MSASDPTNPPDPPPSITDPGASEPGGPDPLDARLLIPAAAGWLTAAVLVGQPPLTAAVLSTLALILAITLGLRLRSRPTHRRKTIGWAAVASLAVVAGLGIAAALQSAALRSGPIRDLAATSATVTVRLKIEGDPSLRQSTTTRRPPYVVVKATIEEVRTPGAQRSPAQATPAQVAPAQSASARRSFGLMLGCVGMVGCPASLRGRSTCGRGRAVVRRGGQEAAQCSLVLFDQTLCSQPRTASVQDQANVASSPLFGIGVEKSAARQRRLDRVGRRLDPNADRLAVRDSDIAFRPSVELGAQRCAGSAVVTARDVVRWWLWPVSSVQDCLVGFVSVVPLLRRHAGHLFLALSWCAGPVGFPRVGVPAMPVVAEGIHPIDRALGVPVTVDHDLLQTYLRLLVGVALSVLSGRFRGLGGVRRGRSSPVPCR